MKNDAAVESSIVKMSEVGVLIEMIDECFTGGTLDRKDRFENALILLKDTFKSHYDGLRTAFYGGAVG